MSSTTQRSNLAWTPYRLQLMCPPDVADHAQSQLIRVLAETALDDWFTVAAPISGTWSLWWDTTAIWRGEGLDPESWCEALLDGWWGSGGGCC